MKGHNYGLCKKCGKVHIHPRPFLGKHHTEEAKKLMMTPEFLASQGRFARNPLAASEAGKRCNVNGKLTGKKSWSKGQTKETNLSLARTSKALKGRPLPHKRGDNNPMRNPEIAKRSAGRQRGQKRPNTSANITSLWKDKKYAVRNIQGQHKKPTVPEQKLKNFLLSHFPQFAYNGDGSQGISINGLTPDFVDVNSHSQFIEHFGCYWHGCSLCFPAMIKARGRDEESTVARYQSYGYHCLVIWEHELNDLECLLQKIEGFTNAKTNISQLC